MSSLNPRDDATRVALDSIDDGGCIEVEAMLDGEAESVVLHRDGDAVRAWLNLCPHAGRRLDWAPGRFLRSKTGELVCAAHGASFSLHDGQCVAGPCRGESLRAVTVQVVDGAIVIGGSTGRPEAAVRTAD